MDLSQNLETEFIWGDVVLELDMSFDNILRFHDLLEDDHLLEEHKLFWGLEALIYNYHKIKHLSPHEQYEIFEYIMIEFLGQDLNKKQAQEEQQGGSTEKQSIKQKEFDFKIDAERIYASFLMDYNIDLFEQQGKLDWRKFLALLGGLSEKTPFMQVVNIRMMEVPKKDDHKNSFEKHKRKIIELKKKYAIEQEEKNADDVFDQLITAFGGRGEDNG